MPRILGQNVEESGKKPHTSSSFENEFVTWQLPKNGLSAQCGLQGTRSGAYDTPAVVALETRKSRMVRELLCQDDLTWKSLLSCDHLVMKHFLTNPSHIKDSDSRARRFEERFLVFTQLAFLRQKQPRVLSDPKHFPGRAAK